MIKMTEELEDAIDDVVDWLNYEVWSANGDTGLEASVKRLNRLFMTEKVKEARKRRAHE